MASLKDQLKFILGNKFVGSNFSEVNVSNSAKMLRLNLKELKGFEKDIEQAFELEKQILINLNTNSFTENSSFEFKKRVISARGIKTIPLWLKLQEYYDKTAKIRTQAITVLQATNAHALQKSVRNNRKQLRDYLNFLRARDPDRKQKLHESLDHEAIINTFPVWLAKASEVAKIFPRNKEMFDFVIIDEASQCDIPSIIPLLQRAKKCIVVGDLNQLGHISFIPKAFEAKLKSQVIDENKYLCKHRDYSFLALVNDSPMPINVAIDIIQKNFDANEERPELLSATASKFDVY